MTYAELLQHLTKLNQSILADEAIVLIDHEGGVCARILSAIILAPNAGGVRGILDGVEIQDPALALTAEPSRLHTIPALEHEPPVIQTASDACLPLINLPPLPASGIDLMYNNDPDNLVDVQHHEVVSIARALAQRWHQNDKEMQRLMVIILDDTRECDTVREYFRERISELEKLLDSLHSKKHSLQRTPVIHAPTDLEKENVKLKTTIGELRVKINRLKLQIETDDEDDDIDLDDEDEEDEHDYQKKQTNQTGKIIKKAERKPRRKMPTS